MVRYAKIPLLLRETGLYRNSISGTGFCHGLPAFGGKALKGDKDYSSGRRGTPWRAALKAVMSCGSIISCREDILDPDVIVLQARRYGNVERCTRQFRR